MVSDAAVLRSKTLSADVPPLAPFSLDVDRTELVRYVMLHLQLLNLGKCDRG